MDDDEPRLSNNPREHAATSVVERRTRARSWAIWLGVLGLVLFGLAFAYAVSRPTNGGLDPATAVIDGDTYWVSVALDLNVPRDALIPHAQISTSNVTSWFTSGNVYRLPGVDPKAALVGEAAPLAEENGAYRLLWGPERADAYPEICQYLTQGMRAATVECQ